MQTSSIRHPWLPILLIAAFSFGSPSVDAAVDGEAYGVETIRPDDEVETSLIIRSQRHNREVKGQIVVLDPVGITLQTRDGEATFPWVEVSSSSAFFTYMKFIDRSSGDDWLRLAAFARGVGAERQAEQSLAEALKRDGSLKAEAARVRDLPLGGLRDSSLGGAGNAPVDEAPAPQEEPAELVENPTEQPLQKFLPATPDEHTAAVEKARMAADEAGRQLGVRFREVETPHFIIFTDWPARDDEYLGETLEEAYRLVAREFDMPWDENIFVGKLPVYMFASHNTFMRYAREIDGHENFRDTVAGYYRSRSDGLGKLIMSTPRQAQEMGLAMARKVWARTLTHEFTHAFVARYRSNGFIPRWLNEGLAELISEQVHPRQGGLDDARRIARRNVSIAQVFDDSYMPPAEMYPVMQSLVQALHRENPQTFVTFIDRIKNGEDAETVLGELYGVDYRGLEMAWRQYMMLN